MSEIGRELQPVPQARLDPGPLGESSRNQLQVLPRPSHQDQRDPPLRVDSDEVDRRVGAQHPFRDQLIQVAKPFS